MPEGWLRRYPRHKSWRDLSAPSTAREIFDRFYRGHAAEEDVSLPGPAWAFYVARKIARAHSGNLVLDKDHLPDDHTTTFRMTLPVVPHESPYESNDACQSI